MVKKNPLKYCINTDEMVDSLLTLITPFNLQAATVNFNFWNFILWKTVMETKLLCQFYISLFYIWNKKMIVSSL